jgi:hypothetical protein
MKLFYKKTKVKTETILLESLPNFITPDERSQISPLSLSSDSNLNSKAKEEKDECYNQYF